MVVMGGLAVGEKQSDMFKIRGNNRLSSKINQGILWVLTHLTC